jgi:hypothetical protein
VSSFPCDCAATTEGKWAGNHSHGCAIFKCGFCGKTAVVAPQGIEPTYCQDCCPDHDYAYERGEGWRCKTCHGEPPLDFYDESDLRQAEGRAP